MQDNLEQLRKKSILVIQASNIYLQNKILTAKTRPSFSSFEIVGEWQSRELLFVFLMTIIFQSDPIQNLFFLFLSVNNSISSKNYFKAINTLQNIIFVMIAQEHYAVFVDNSGSVGGCVNYWDTVNTILNDYAKDITHYYLWNSQCGLSSKKLFEQSIASKRGTGGTSPQYVAEEIAKNKFENIILVTDGEVGDHDVSKCDKILEESKQKENFKIKKAICYVIGSYSEPNLSVTCPFTRYSESTVFSRTGAAEVKSVMQYTAEDYKILDSLEELTLENFEAKYDTIQKLIIAQNMGKDGNLPLKNQLVTLKNRLIKELSKKLGKQGDYSTKVRSLLEAKNVEGALQMIVNMATRYYEESGTGELQQKINYLISLCGDMRGQYSLGQIKSNKMATAKIATAGELDKNQEVEDLSKNPIECPIIMDQDVPQILVDECQPFLLGVEKCIVDDINACPLRLLNYPTLKAKFKARLSNFTGIKYCDKLHKNPFTQNRLLGAIPLGTHKSHITVGNHTIAKLVSGGKVMGNMNLYLAVIWILVNEDQIEYLKPIKANLAENLIFRLKTTKTMASMCGLSQFCSTQINNDIALWHCVNSGYLNNPTEKDTFRFHLYNIEPMLKILKLLDYPLHEGFERHYLRTLALHAFSEKYKRLNVRERKSFKNLFRGLYQKGFLVQLFKLGRKFRQVEMCSEFIPVDGKADETQVQAVKARLPSFCKKMTNEDLLYICSLIDETKQVAEIQLDYNIVVPELPATETNWKYELKHFEHKIEINPETIRPQSQLLGRDWHEIAQETYGIEEKQMFKGCKYFGEFIIKYKTRPNKDELAIFYYNRYIEAGKKNTLPHLTEQWINDFLVAYEPIFEKKTIPEIVESLKASAKKEKVHSE